MARRIQRKSKTQMRKKARTYKKNNRKPTRKYARKSKRRSNKVKRKYTRRIKKIKMKGGNSVLGRASYTTLTKLSPNESMMANPVPFSKVNTCVDNYNHYAKA